MVLRASDSSRANTPAELSSLRPVVMKESVIVTPAAAPTSAERRDWLRLKGVGIAAAVGVQRHARTRSARDDATKSCARDCCVTACESMLAYLTRRRCS